MAQSYKTYPGDGTTDTFSVTFPYVDKGNVQVTVNSVPVSFIWLNATSVKLTAVPALGSTVVIGRDTPISSTIRTYVNDANLTQQTLQDNANQLLYALQEAYDAFESTVTVDPADGALNAANHIIKNVGTGSAPDHAVNVAQLGQHLAQTQAAKDAAEGYKNAASSSAQVAASSASSAAASATTAQNAATSANGAASFIQNLQLMPMITATPGKGQVVSLAGDPGNGLSLPGGGTWFYYVCVYTQASNTFYSHTVNVAIGGATIYTGDINFYYRGFAIRVS